MGKISAQAIGHSINKSVSRKEFRYGHPEIMTMKLVFPRHILGEAKTHRIMSINDNLKAIGNVTLPDIKLLNF